MILCIVTFVCFGVSEEQRCQIKIVTSFVLAAFIKSRIYSLNMCQYWSDLVSRPTHAASWPDKQSCDQCRDVYKVARQATAMF
jgi:hypothetical protein